MNILAISVATVALLTANYSGTQPTLGQTTIEAEISAAKTTIKWQAEVQDLGEIEQGKPATVYFNLENTGDAPLVIKQVKTSCGCTVSDYEKEPILPGQSSKIKATYSAKAKGAFSKTVTVYANTEAGTKTLILKGKVV